MNKFTILYDDNTTFSGNPLKRDWMKIDQTKKILKLEYVLNKTLIVLEGYKQYNHLLEFVALGQKGIQRILLMGRKNDDTDIIIIDLRKNKI